MTPDRPADLAARLLLTERDALLPILRRTPEAAFDRPTVCTGWSVRDVLALRFGAAAELATDVATLMRLCAGRHPDPARFTLAGADLGQFVLFA